jgi:peroxiredoxin
MLNATGDRLRPINMKETPELTVTEKRAAPDFTYVDSDGNEIRLSDLWSSAEKGIVLVFLRHFGCLFCRDHAAQLRKHYDDFRARGFEVVAIGQGTPARSEKFQQDYSLPFPVLGDRARESYRRYGLTSTALGSFLDPRAYVSGIRSLLHGKLPGLPDGDVSQNPGTFLIDRSGHILRAEIGQHAGDFPSAAEIVCWIDQTAP